MVRKSPSLVNSVAFQVVLIFILGYYLFNGVEDRRRKQCMKPLIWNFKVCSSLTTRCFDGQIDLTVAHAVFAILLNSAFLILLKLWPDYDVRAEEAVLNFLVYWVYCFTLFVRLVGYLLDFNFPLVLQTANIWEQNIVFTTIQCLFFVALGYLGPPLVDHYFMNWDRMNEAIRRWNRHEDGRISAVTLLCIVVQALLFIEIFRNAAIWATQSNKENLETFSYSIADFKLFKLMLITEFYDIAYKIYKCMILSLTISYLPVGAPDGLTLRRVIGFLFGILGSRFIAMGFYYGRNDFLHNQVYHAFKWFAYVINLFIVAALAHIAFESLDVFVPNHERVDLAKPSKEKHYFSKERVHGILG